MLPQEAIAAFLSAIGSAPMNYTITPLGGGLINFSYKLIPLEGPSLLLQCINTKVFKDPLAVQNNFIKIWEYNKTLEQPQFLADPIFLNTANTLFIDSQERYWRAFQFIEGSAMKPLPEDASQCASTATCFATYTAAWKDFDTNLLQDVLPQFHHLSLRFHQFENSLKQAKKDRLDASRELMDALTSRKNYSLFFDWLVTQEASFPKRVMHHDAKIANMLFEAPSGSVIGAVDFDTLMPGYFFSDLGDMIRSMACSADENNTQFDQLHILQENYQALLQGYLSVMGPVLTKEENSYIHHAGLIMYYMQSLRFLTDYLNGDVYYQVNYPDQNFDRAMNQFCLLKDLETFLQNAYNYDPMRLSEK